MFGMLASALLLMLVAMIKLLQLHLGPVVQSGFRWGN